jgi:hypothetical protein
MSPRHEGAVGAGADQGEWFNAAPEFRLLLRVAASLVPPGPPSIALFRGFCSSLLARQQQNTKSGQAGPLADMPCKTCRQ